MKSACIVALLLALSGTAPAQTRPNVPPTVKAAFTRTYGGATRVKWDQKEGAREASFTRNGQAQSALFDAAGKQTESEITIPVRKLPDAVRAYLKQQGKAIKEAARITDAAGKTYYEAESGGQDYLFTADGKPVKKIGQ